MHSRQPDYYAILNLPPASTIKDVQDQYRKLVKVFHPDRNAGDEWYGEQLKRYNEAYEFLSSPERKAAYDASRDRRLSDAVPFEHTFEAPVADEGRDGSEEAWTFTAGDVPIGAAKTINLDPKIAEVFSQASVVATPRLRTTPIESAKRTRTIRLFIAAAAIVVLLVVVIAIKMQPDDNALAGSAAVPVAGPSPKLALPKASSSSSLQIDTPLPSQPPSLGVNQAIQQGTPVSLYPPQITTHDMQVADAATHADALKRRAMVAPYWERYAGMQQAVGAAMEADREKLSAMEAEDEHDAASGKSEDRRQAESRLWDGIRATKDKLTTVQSQFDDLEYLSSSEDAKSSLKILGDELDDLQRYSNQPRAVQVAKQPRN